MKLNPIASNMTEVETIYDGLISIKEHGPEYKTTGICKNLDYCLLNVFRGLCEGFPFLSEDSVFPVPGSKKDLSGPAAVAAYLSCTDKWDKQTEYGQIRWELVDYVIKKCEDILERGPLI